MTGGYLAARGRRRAAAGSAPAPATARPSGSALRRTVHCDIKCTPRTRDAHVAVLLYRVLYSHYCALGAGARRRTFDLLDEVVEEVQTQHDEQRQDADERHVVGDVAGLAHALRHRRRHAHRAAPARPTRRARLSPPPAAAAR